MLRWMSGVTLRDRKRTAELVNCLGVENVEQIVGPGQLRWYGHGEQSVKIIND